MHEPTVPDDDADWEPSTAAIRTGPPDDLPWRMWEDRLDTSEPVNQLAAAVATKFTPGLNIDVTDGVDFAAHQMLAMLVYRCTMQEPLLSMERLASHLVRYPGIPKRLGLPRDNQPSADTLRWWWDEKLERGMADRPMDIMIDGTARSYHKRSDTDVKEPPGVHRRYQKFETGYGWEDLTITALYRGRAIVLASFSYLPENSHFQTVRYLIDRAQDLVNVRNVYADSEFATQESCSYLNHCGLDYVTSKRETSKVADAVEEMSGKADWAPYEIEGGDHSIHKTTLFAVETRSKHADEPDGSESDDDDDNDLHEDQTTLVDDDDEAEQTEFQIDHDEVESENLLSFAEATDTADLDYAVFITSLDIDSVGMDPRLNPVAHDPTGTVWGAAELYRRRWSAETAFRDLKRNFKASPRSRCLGIRRYFMMLCIHLYNYWVLCNLIVADECDHLDDDDDIVWRKKIFVIDFYNEVFADSEYG